ncbi:Olfactory receptor 6V1 [Dissostichus eleginoides]|uniref:Olfactory receptor 6V1 n=1 Tax=Dissostichus eleginoides TaxID=100907 RepID=A0AAD9B1R8_DISEL|nr:Olfactory receptor 6V1 [Dissostichus eleginoides]
MTSAGFNVTSSLTLVGFSSLSGHSSLLFFVFLLLYLFVLFSDSLVIYIICSQRALHRPMFAFVASFLLNSLTASTLIYPKIMSDLLLSGAGLVQVSRTLCLCQGFFVSSLGGSSFMLLSAMAFDRYLSICYPMHYAVLSNRESDSTVITSILILAPTVLNPVVYGLKLKEVFTHVKRLLSCRRDS